MRSWKYRCMAFLGRGEFTNYRSPLANSLVLFLFAILVRRRVVQNDIKSHLSNNRSIYTARLMPIHFYLQLVPASRQARGSSPAFCDFKSAAPKVWINHSVTTSHRANPLFTTLENTANTTSKSHFGNCPSPIEDHRTPEQKLHLEAPEAQTIPDSHPPHHSRKHVELNREAACEVDSTF